MNAALVLILLVVGTGIVLVAPPGVAPGALAMGALFSIPTIIILAKGADRTFLLRMFIAALIIRLVVGTVIFVAHMQDFLVVTLSPMTPSDRR